MVVGMLSREEQIELSVRRILAEETTKFREHLEKQIRLFGGMFLALISLAAGLALFLLGRSFNEVEERVMAQVDQRMIEYRIDAALKKRLQELIEVAISSQETANLIQEATTKTVETQVQQRADTIIDKAVTKAVADARMIDLQGAIDSAVSRKLDAINRKQSWMQMQLRGLEAAAGLPIPKEGQFIPWMDN
jgi:hypothetical protein